MRTVEHVQVVSGDEAGYATVTEDGGFAREYKSLTEVLVSTDSYYTDAYYFVNKDNAERFMENLNE